MHGDGLARISDTLLRDEIARLVFRPPDGHWVRVIEGREVKPLGQNEHQRSELPSPSHHRLVMASRAGVHVWRRNTIEIARKRQRTARIGQRESRSLSQRPSAPFLNGPIRRE